MNKVRVGDQLLPMPTKADIENLKEGDLAPNCFGEESPITQIFAKDTDISGRKFICYYVKFGPNGQISHSLTEGEIDFPCTDHRTAQEQMLLRCKLEPHL